VTDHGLFPASGPSGLARPDGAVLVLVRHGETAWNRSRKIQGHIDIGLNPTGIAQARATANELAGMPIAAIHASDLARAWQTAEAIAGPHRLAVIADPELRERHWGRFQGLRFEEIARDFPDAAASITARDPAFAPEGGESIETLEQRVRRALDRIGEKAAGQTIVVVTHGGVLDAAYRIATGLPLSAPRSFPLTNAAINVVERAAGRWAVRTWGGVRHLAALDRRDELG
jgi:probable phosphoglycerate mutase